MPTFPWSSKSKPSFESMRVPPRAQASGYRFSLKGSPRHYDNVKQLLERNGAKVYFGEPLTYERGAGVALWRVRAANLEFLPKLYDWWAEMERVEPIAFTFHLYMPDDLKYPAMDLRDHTPEDVAAYIEANAPWDGRRPVSTVPTQMPAGQPTPDSH